MNNKKNFMNKLLLVISISIITILLSTYFAISPVNTPASPVDAVFVSNITPESPQPLENLHGYQDEILSAGKLLVASQKLKDPYFAKTIVLLVRYSNQGAAGLIINRPTDTKLNHIFPNVKGIQRLTDKLYFGGPVGRSQITMIIQSSSKPDASSKLFDTIYLSSSLSVLEQMIGNRKPDQRFRLYSGYAGWRAGQLESEITKKDWKILKGNPDILFNKAPDEIWQKLVPQDISI